MSKKEISEKFGIDLDKIGNWSRDWWIVNKIEEEEKSVGAKIGDLCIQTRYGVNKPIDMLADNFVGTAEDRFDATCQYYYYRPIN